MPTRLFTYVHTLRSNRVFTLAFRAFVTFAAFAWIVARLDLAQFTHVAFAPNWTMLALMILTALLFLFLGSVKVWILLAAFARVSLARTLVYFMVATAIGAFTPAALGDFSMAAFLRRENVPLHHGLSVMLVDRVLSILLYALVFLPLTLYFLLDERIEWWPAVLVLAFTVGTLGFNSVASVRRFVRTRLIQRLTPPLVEFARAVSDLLRLYPWRLVANIALGIVRAMIAGVVVFFALAAAGTFSPLGLVICASNALTLINLVPLSLGGMGIYEAGGIALFERMGLDRASVFAGLLYQRAYILTISLLILAGMPLVSRAVRRGGR